MIKNELEEITLEKIHKFGDYVFNLTGVSRHE